MLLNKVLLAIACVGLAHASVAQSVPKVATSVGKPSHKALLKPKRNYIESYTWQNNGMDGAGLVSAITNWNSSTTFNFPIGTGDVSDYVSVHGAIWCSKLNPNITTWNGAPSGYSPTVVGMGSSTSTSTILQFGSFPNTGIAFVTDTPSSTDFLQVSTQPHRGDTTVTVSGTTHPYAVGDLVILASGFMAMPIWAPNASPQRLDSEVCQISSISKTFLPFPGTTTITFSDPLKHDYNTQIPCCTKASTNSDSNHTTEWVNDGATYWIVDASKQSGFQGAACGTNITIDNIGVQGYFNNTSGIVGTDDAMVFCGMYNPTITNVSATDYGNEGILMNCIRDGTVSGITLDSGNSSNSNPVGALYGQTMKQTTSIDTSSASCTNDQENGIYLGPCNYDDHWTSCSHIAFDDHGMNSQYCDITSSDYIRVDLGNGNWPMGLQHGSFSDLNLGVGLADLSSYPVAFGFNDANNTMTDCRSGCDTDGLGGNMCTGIVFFPAASSSLATDTTNNKTMVFDIGGSAITITLGTTTYADVKTAIESALSIRAQDIVVANNSIDDSTTVIGYPNSSTAPNPIVFNAPELGYTLWTGGGMNLANGSGYTASSDCTVYNWVPTGLTGQGDGAAHSCSQSLHITSDLIAAYNDASCKTLMKTRQPTRNPAHFINAASTAEEFYDFQLSGLSAMDPCQFYITQTGVSGGGYGDCMDMGQEFWFCGDMTFTNVQFQLQGSALGYMLNFGTSWLPNSNTTGYSELTFVNPSIMWDASYGSSDNPLQYYLITNSSDGPVNDMVTNISGNVGFNWSNVGSHTPAFSQSTTDVTVNDTGTYTYSTTLLYADGSTAMLPNQDDWFADFRTKFGAAPIADSSLKRPKPITRP